MEYFGENTAYNTNEAKRLRGNGETILIVDDEIVFVEVTKLLLELYGYTILTAYDGIEGVSIFNANKEQIKIIVCDLNMPRLGGRTILKKFIKINPEIKILIISGSIDEEYLVDYLVQGKLEYLQKPFLTEMLLETLKKMLQQQSKN